MTEWKIWEDGKRADAFCVLADSISDALDLAAERFGYADYSDMAQDRGWGEDDGLNISEC